jgi:hypothetical protein
MRLKLTDQARLMASVVCAGRLHGKPSDWHNRKLNAAERRGVEGFKAMHALPADGAFVSRLALFSGMSMSLRRTHLVSPPPRSKTPALSKVGEQLPACKHLIKLSPHKLKTLC